MDGIEKSVPGIAAKPIFTMDHIKNVANQKDHASAKKIAHEAINSSGAHEYNKHAAKNMVDKSNSTAHLAQGMTNFHMAHEAKIRRRVKGNKDHE